MVLFIHILYETLDISKLDIYIILSWYIFIFLKKKLYLIIKNYEKIEKFQNCEYDSKFLNFIIYYRFFCIFYQNLS